MRRIRNEKETYRANQNQVLIFLERTSWACLSFHLVHNTCLVYHSVRGPALLSTGMHLNLKDDRYREENKRSQTKKKNISIREKKKDKEEEKDKEDEKKEKRKTHLKELTQKFIVTNYIVVIHFKTKLSLNECLHVTNLYIKRLLP